MTVVNVNGHQVETGCWVDGHWGQYGPDHLADQAEAFGWKPATERDDPRWWRDMAEALASEVVPNGCPPGVDEPTAWENHIESADDIERWLNDHTPDGFVWTWIDGEFFLAAVDEDGEFIDDEE